MPPSWTPVATWDDYPPRRGLGYLIDASLDSLSISCRSLRPSTPPGHSSSLAKDPGRVIEFRQFRIERFFRPQRLISTNQFLRSYPSHRISLLAPLRTAPLGAESQGFDPHANPNPLATTCRSDLGCRESRSERRSSAGDLSSGSNLPAAANQAPAQPGGSKKLRDGNPKRREGFFRY